MKKRFALLMAALLCGAMFAMPALAEQAVVQPGTLDSQILFTQNVDFDNGYYGFCLMVDRRAAAVGDVFDVVQTSGNIINNQKTDVSNAMKILVVDRFDDFYYNGTKYNMDDEGNFKMKPQGVQKYQSAVYWMMDNSYKTSQDIITMAQEALAKASKASSVQIPDSGYVKTLRDGTEAVFDFKVFKSTQGEVGGLLQQDFIGFKVANKPAGDEPDPDDPNPDDPNPDDPNPDDPNPDDPNPDDPNPDDPNPDDPNPDDPNPDNPNPDDPNPDDPNPDDPNPDDPNPDELKDAVKQLPKTGDNTSLTLWALMMAGCLTALTVLNRRAKSRN